MTILYKLFKIETKQFAMFPNLFVTGEEALVDAELSFTPNIDRTNIRSVVMLKYKQGDNLLMILELACFFEIAPEGWDEMKEDSQWKVPADFMRHLGTIVVGTARGVLHTKTEGTVLNACILPPINVVELVKEDFIVKQ